MTADQPPTMALPHAHAVVRILALEPAINEHLIKLLGADVPDGTQAA
jgi:hypothetical protein